MPNSDIILTHKGVRELEAKLEDLKTNKRKEIAEQIKIARAFGDISENAEYDEAKNEQAKIEGEIIAIENMLNNAIIVDEEEVDLRTVNVGTTVKLLDKEFKEEVEYQIVGSVEANVEKNKISNESPVGRALLGKKVGSIVKVDTPDGCIKYQILDIHR
jgi:transcription elongation factor GreA